MKKNPLIRFAVKVLILSTIILVVQIATVRISPPYGPSQFFSKIQYDIEKRGADILYFGDSSNLYTSLRDPLKRSISQWIQFYLPNHTVGDIASAGFGADVYLEFAKALIKKNRCPKVVVIPINLGSFGPVWERNPQFQFEEEKLKLNTNYLVYLFYRPLISFKYLSRISDYEFENTPVYKGRVKIGVVKDFYNKDQKEHPTKERIKYRMALRYMYKLSPNHRKVKAIGAIADLLLAHHSRPVFYIGSIDCETGERHWPGEFNAQVKKNISVLQSVLSSRGLRAVDLSAAVGSKDFVDGVYPQEHVDETGRRLAGEEIAKVISAIQ